jgi:muramoyltetrapeptide carboxypeptidase
MSDALRMPSPLAPGRRIQAIAPSGPFDPDAFSRGLARLRARYDVRHAPDVLDRAGFLAGSDERRLAELLRAIEDDAVHAIVAARGGYGATRILDRVPPDLVARHPKLLVGFSDVTALHAVWARAGVRSLHASMVAFLGDTPEARFERWVRAVEGAPPAPLVGLAAIAPGRARGPLLGGNLAVLTSLFGTPHALPLDGAVLFLEDTDERPYRVDRMLTTWRQAGALSRVAGIALGAFTRCDPGTDGVRVEAVLRERLRDLGVPVVEGVPAGHVDDNLELSLGATVVLDADAGTLAFEV